MRNLTESKDKGSLADPSLSSVVSLGRYGFTVVASVVTGAAVVAGAAVSVGDSVVAGDDSSGIFMINGTPGCT